MPLKPLPFAAIICFTLAAFAMAASSAYAVTPRQVEQRPALATAKQSVIPAWPGPPLPPSPPPFVEETVITYDAQGISPDQQLKMEIQNTGDITLIIGTTESGIALNTEELSHLTSLAETADFFALKGKYDGPKDPSDIYDTITLRQNGSTKTVTLLETTDNGSIPPALVDLVAALRRIAIELWKRDHLPDYPFPLPLFPNPTRSQAFTITFEEVGLGIEATLQIGADGKASLDEPGYGIGRFPYQLSPELLAQLSSQITKADFFNKQDFYTFQDPPNLFSETPFYNVILTQGGRSKEISMRGIGSYEPTLDALFENLYSIYKSRTIDGINEAQELVVADVSTHTGAGWFLIIDTDGNVYVQGINQGRLRQSELQELKRLFRQNDWFGLNEAYTLPYNGQPQARIRFSLNGQTKQVDASGGADVPVAIDIMIKRLFEVYLQFRSNENLQIGMPKAGRPTQPDYVGVAALALFSGLLGMSLRQLAKR